MKPWQDMVTHRILLRTEAAPDGGGGPGGGARPPVRLARWLLPDDPTVIRYEIFLPGIHLC